MRTPLLKLPGEGGLPWGVIGGVVLASVPIWLLLRLLLGATPLLDGRLPFPPYLGGLRASVVVVVLVSLLVLRDARRMNERVFAENVGVSESVVGAIAATSALVLEVLLHVARSVLAGGVG